MFNEYTVCVSFFLTLFTQNPFNLISF